jgi:hypothetical protein
MTTSRPERPSLPAMKSRCSHSLSQRRANCRGEEGPGDPNDATENGDGNYNGTIPR